MTLQGLQGGGQFVTGPMFGREPGLVGPGPRGLKMVIIRPGTTLSALGFPGMEASIKGSGNTVQAPRIKFLRFIKFIGMAFLVLLGLKGFATHGHVSGYAYGRHGWTSLRLTPE